jgi:hypothetical protein
VTAGRSEYRSPSARRLFAACFFALLFAAPARAQPTVVAAVISGAGHAMTQPGSTLQLVCVVAQPGAVAVSRAARLTLVAGFLRSPPNAARPAPGGGMLIRFR